MKAKFLLPLALFALLAVVLGVGVKRSPEKSTIQSALLGKPAPQFALPSLTDPVRTVNSREFAGRPYVLNVWGTWCGECRVEHTMLMQASAEQRVPFVGLNWKDDNAAALAWLAQLGNPYQAIAVDSDGRTAIDFGVYGAPETFLIDANGIVVHRHVGALTREVWEREFLARLPPSAS
ncbi:MAG TPA: DsbE family thiol:disulfide interchange protein [Steroidobacteraceae bacterium]|nr:DsbE family thiol:disulfide interchange protein [Steroidobacteraceae bacterium]HRX88804.1 DsbE family thiol:disulfide interchange protein [Steroidobacteraceae bacterium]